MFVNDFHFLGMNIIWWFIWLILLIWIFAIPYDIPGQRKQKDFPLNILNKRLAHGEISMVQFEELKSIIKKNQ